MESSHAEESLNMHGHSNAHGMRSDASEMSVQTLLGKQEDIAHHTQAADDAGMMEVDADISSEELIRVQQLLEKEKLRVLQEHRQRLDERKKLGKDTRGRPGKSELYVLSAGVLLYSLNCEMCTEQSTAVGTASQRAEGCRDRQRRR
jgi:hypothetical protein